MKKRLIVFVIIVLLNLLFIAPLQQSVAKQAVFYDHHMQSHPTGEMKLQRIFLFAQIQGEAEITGSFFAKKLFEDPIGRTIYSNVLINGTVISEPEKLKFFTIWSPFAFLPWKLWDDLPIYLNIRLFDGIIEHNETQNTVRIVGTGAFIYLIAYVNVPWNA